MTADSYRDFIKGLIMKGHESVLEHASITMKATSSRGVLNELVRHRIAAYSQESTRYCNYLSNRFGGLSFIIPSWIEGNSIEDIMRESGPASVWCECMENAEFAYSSLLRLGWTPEQARDVLPLSLASTIVATYNIRQWRHILSQRLSKKSHPQMRRLMGLVYDQFMKYLPSLFEDIKVEKS